MSILLQKGSEEPFRDLLLKLLQARCESGLQLTTAGLLSSAECAKNISTPTSNNSISDNSFRHMLCVNPHSYTGVNSFHIFLPHKLSKIPEIVSQLHDPRCFCPPTKFCHPSSPSRERDPVRSALNSCSSSSCFLSDSSHPQQTGNYKEMCHQPVFSCLAVPSAGGVGRVIETNGPPHAPLTPPRKAKNLTNAVTVLSEHSAHFLSKIIYFTEGEKTVRGILSTIP